MVVSAPIVFSARLVGIKPWRVASWRFRFQEEEWGPSKLTNDTVSFDRRSWLLWLELLQELGGRLHK